MLRYYAMLRVNWVCGVMALNMGCEFHDRGSISSESQIPHDVDLEQVNFT